MPYTPYQSTWNNPYLPVTNQGQPVLPMANPYQQPVNGVIKVNGRDSAMQYQLPPNSTSPALFDQSGTCFYIVTTDGTGMKTVECFDFTPHVEQQPVQIDGAQFVSRQEFEDFTAKVNAALGALNGVHESIQTAGTANADAGANVTAPVNAAGGHIGAGQQPSQMGYDDGYGYNRGGQVGRGGYGYEQGGYGYERGGRRGYNQGRGQGYEQGGRGYRRGYRGQSRDSMGRYTSRRGYRRMENYGHQDMMAEIRQMMETADPQEKEQLKMQLRQMTEM